jgi:hypothetical protein
VQGYNFSGDDGRHGPNGQARYAFDGMARNGTYYPVDEYPTQAGGEYFHPYYGQLTEHDGYGRPPFGQPWGRYRGSRHVSKPRLYLVFTKA